VCLEKNILLHLYIKNALVYYNAGVAVVKSKIVGLAPGQIISKSLPPIHQISITISHFYSTLKDLTLATLERAVWGKDLIS
jgi:hypothetical protein